MLLAEGGDVVTCERLEEEGMLAYLGEEMDTHVKGCPDCRRSLRQYEQIAAALAQASLPDGWTEELKSRLMAKAGSRHPKQPPARAEAPEECHRSAGASPIGEELRLDILARARRRFQRELDRVLQMAVEARLEELTEMADQVLKHVFDRVDEEAMARLEVAMTFQLETLVERAGKELALGLKQTLVDAVRRGIEEYRKTRPGPIQAEGQHA